MKNLAVEQYKPFSRKSIIFPLIFISSMVAGMLIVILPVQAHFDYIKSVDAYENIESHKNIQARWSQIMQEEMIATIKSDNKDYEDKLKVATASAKRQNLTKAEAFEMINTTFPEQYRARFKKITTECENKYLDTGATHVNKDGTEDVGMSQINNAYHTERVQKLFGMDFDVAMRIPLLNYIYAAWLVEHDTNFHQWACDQLV